jgi:hypothetical protein
MFFSHGKHFEKINDRIGLTVLIMLVSSIDRRPEVRRAQMAWQSQPVIATMQQTKKISRTHTVVQQRPIVNVTLDITEEKIGPVLNAIPVLCAILTHLQLIHVFQAPQMIQSSVFARTGFMVTVQHARLAKSATLMRRPLSCARMEA